MSEGEKTKRWILPLLLMAFVLGGIVGIILVSFPQPSAMDTLVIFEEQHLAGMTYVEVAAIRSGDVEIRLSVSDFVESCVNKTVYRFYNELSSQDSVRYVFFVKGSDEELVEYFFSIRYVPVFPNSYLWYEMTVSTGVTIER